MLSNYFALELLAFVNQKQTVRKKDATKKHPCYGFVAMSDKAYFRKERKVPKPSRALCPTPPTSPKETC